MDGFFKIAVYSYFFLLYQRKEGRKGKKASLIRMLTPAIKENNRKKKFDIYHASIE